MRHYHKNPRRITKQEFAQLTQWLRELGDLSGIVHDLNTDEVIGGNQRMEVFDLATAKIEIAEQLEAPDDQGTVARGYVVWEGHRYTYRAVRWTPKQCEQANIVANKAGGSFDFDILANEFELPDLLNWGFDEKELLGVFPDEPTGEDPGAQIDKAEELRVKWGVELGQLWQLGEHRLICGDCTDRAVVERVMGGEKAGALITDPPYGINIVGKNGTAGNFPGTNAPRLKAVPIVGDDKPFDPSHLLNVSDIVVLWGGNNFADKLSASSKWLVWDKKDGAFEGSDLGDCELAWTNQKGASRLIHHTWQGMYRKGEGEREARLHPTQKPVALMEWCIEKMDVPTDAIICDFYLGSGTTLIACERLSRKCRAVEISPGYVAVAIQRWVDMTGQTPVLVTE